MSVNKNRSNIVNLNQLVTTIPLRKKLVDQDDRDKFEWNQWQSATKAVNNVESPAKEKHVRNLIIGTFRLEGTRLFWSMVIRIHIESHPIVSWKFCYVIHRILRDGHKNVIGDCILLSTYFDQLGKYWSGVQQSYGLLTYRYCHLLITKLKFHERNPLFTGTLTIDDHNDIRRLFKENSNLDFQLCIELFDYMEDILNLVQVIFTSLDQSRANSMTSAGQCRLNPIVICIQDSSLLYDYIVKIIFKLHEGLPPETLQGHRHRLTDQFRRLKRFYSQSSTLQYFKNLIKVPMLPEDPPNFNIKEDLKNYQTPIAILSTPPSDSSQLNDDLLIDTSDDTRSTLTTTMSDDFSSNTSRMSDLEQRLMQYDAMLKQNRSETDDLHRTIATKDAELIAERNNRLQIEEQFRKQLDNQQRIEEMNGIDSKTNSNEKFNKLLDTYNKLREEHVVVLRREGESKQQLADLNQQYAQLKEDHQKKEDEFNQNYEKINNEIIQLRQTNDELQDRIQILTNERNDYQSITITTSERIKELDNDKSSFEKKLKETEGTRQGLFDKNREHEEDLIDLIHEKETLEQKVLDLEQTAREWAQKFIDTMDKQKLMQINHENILNNLKRQYKYSILTYCINQMHDGIDRIKGNKNDTESKLQMAVISTKKVQDLWKKQNQGDETATLPFLNESITLANCMVDIAQDNCRDVILYCIDLYTNYQTSSTSEDIDKQSNELIRRLNLLIEK